MIADPVRLAPRDVAAMRLALYTLRDGGDDEAACEAVARAYDVLLAAPALHPYCDVLMDAWRESYVSEANAARLLRARLACLLRAVLRASAGDYGTQPRHCFREWRAATHERPFWLSMEEWRHRMRSYPGPGHCGDCGGTRATCTGRPGPCITPLWSLAPETRAR